MNLRRYYNQNRKKIWGILIIMASVFVLIQIIEFILQKNGEDTKINQNIVMSNISTDTSKLVTDKSVVTGEHVSQNNLEEATKTIDLFINYCNEKHLEKAYSLLTDDCKKEIFDSLEAFEEGYYNNIFNGESKVCNIENWTGNTYKVRIMEDSISTGKSNNGYAKEDYITVEEVENEYKLNINNYIGHTTIDEKTQENNIEVNVLSKDTYKDYEEYTIKVTNNTANTVLLDELENSQSLYIQDSKKIKYSSYNHELSKAMLTVNSGQTKEISIKFYISYVQDKKIKSMTFSDLLIYNDEQSGTFKFEAKV